MTLTYLQKRIEAAAKVLESLQNIEQAQGCLPSSLSVALQDLEAVWASPVYAK
jgi:hypothetical protein